MSPRILQEKLVRSSSPPYKPKPQRVETPGTARFLTFGVYHHHRLFNYRVLVEMFIEDLTTRSKESGIDLWGYVVMPNHVHLLLFPPGEADVRRFLMNLKRVMSRRGLSWLNDNQEHVWQRLLDSRGNPRFWQRGGGHDHSLTDPDAIHAKLKYMHDNPVRAGLVDDPVDYPYSSCREWESGEFRTINPRYYPSF